MWCIGKITSEYIARLENVLATYARPYNAKYPVICFDERPCFLIADIKSPIHIEQGKPKREHYAYEKKGSCCLLGSIEPLTGMRLFQVQKQRRKREYALHLKALADRYPKAKKIIVVQDNLNTHTTSSFYETFPASKARALAERFEFIFTPKSASWLNMIEIEFSALSRSCLNRRIGDMATLEREVLAFADDREQKQIKIDWQFNVYDARETFSRHYNAINETNKL